jgi:hypothetical protein
MTLLTAGAARTNPEVKRRSAQKVRLGMFDSFASQAGEFI